jgi:hypothetical protein
VPIPSMPIKIRHPARFRFWKACSKCVIDLEVGSNARNGNYRIGDEPLKSKRGFMRKAQADFVYLTTKLLKTTDDDVWL